MIGKITLLWMAALPLMGSPGPATMSVAATGAAYGSARGLRYMLGVSTGTCGVLVLIATGVTGVVLAMPGAVAVITVLGTAYILYLAYKIATAPVISDEAETKNAPSYASGFMLAIANPKAYAAIGAIFSSKILLPDDVIMDAVVKVLALLIVVIGVNSAWLLFGSAFSLILKNPRYGRIANITFAALLVGSVVLVFI